MSKQYKNNKKCYNFYKKVVIKMKLILASNSKTRKEILNKVGLKYETVPSNIQEYSEKQNPKE